MPAGARAARRSSCSVRWCHVAPIVSDLRVDGEARVCSGGRPSSWARAAACASPSAAAADRALASGCATGARTRRDRGMAGLCQPAPRGTSRMTLRWCTLAARTTSSRSVDLEHHIDERAALEVDAREPLPEDVEDRQQARGRRALRVPRPRPAASRASSAAHAPRGTPAISSSLDAKLAIQRHLRRCRPRATIRVHADGAGCRGG